LLLGGGGLVFVFLDTGHGLVLSSQPRALVRGTQLDEAPPLLLRPAGVNEYDTLVSSFVFVLSLVAFVLFSLFCRFLFSSSLRFSLSSRRTPNV
jgi:hypothetical protein